MAARRGPGPGPVLLAVLAVLGPGRPLRGARAALDLQELSELKYGLEILAEPVLAGQVRGGGDGVRDRGTSVGVGGTGRGALLGRGRVGVGDAVPGAPDLAGSCGSAGTGPGGVGVSVTALPQPLRGSPRSQRLPSSVPAAPERSPSGARQRAGPLPRPWRQRGRWQQLPCVPVTAPR